MFERFYVKQYGKRTVHPLAQSDKTECGLEIAQRDCTVIVAPLDQSLYGDLCVGCVDVIKMEARRKILDRAIPDIPHTGADCKYCDGG